MAARKTDARPYVPDARTIAELREAAQNCRGCSLCRFATQAVFGEMDPGTKRSSHAKMMMIGEQPGDKEDLSGRPFVGPAGKFLDQCLVKAGIERKDVYITNSVKHFKWERRGKIRLHKKPSLTEVHACRPWLDAELDIIRPALIVCLGSVAAQGFLGADFRVTALHGQEQRVPGLPPIIATVHPASILRAREQDRMKHTAQFISDLRRAADFLD